MIFIAGGENQLNPHAGMGAGELHGGLGGRRQEFLLKKLHGCFLAGMGHEGADQDFAMEQYRDLQIFLEDEKDVVDMLKEGWEYGSGVFLAKHEAVWCDGEVAVVSFGQTAALAFSQLTEFGRRASYRFHAAGSRSSSWGGTGLRDRRSRGCIRAWFHSS